MSPDPANMTSPPLVQSANMTTPPLVQSVSVGTTEHEYVEEMGLPYVIRINQEFQKAGLRGLTLLFASGDTARWEQASQRYKGKMWINFPAASPYVTAVGGAWLGDLGDGMDVMT
ncbi:hypothetical protein T484DRAFT_1773764 [Baffinella frigidus]|nr:hypothetical protein T484DRAFT_1773764 [Cryptophyta sp. CCMP2293]